MANEIIRDSCILYEQQAYDELDRLVNGEIAELIQQKELNIVKHNGIKICPICKADNFNNNEDGLCQSCEMLQTEEKIWNY